MKFKVFNEETLPQKRSNSSTLIAMLSFGKAGTITFNIGAQERMELKAGSKVSVSKDEEDEDCWYVYVDNARGFTLRTHSDKKNLMFNHKMLANQVKSHFGLDDTKTQRFLICSIPTTIKGDQTKYWGLIAPVK